MIYNLTTNIYILLYVRWKFFLGLTLLVFGAILMMVAVGYQALGWYSSSRLDEYSFTTQRPEFPGDGYGVSTTKNTFIDEPAPQSGNVILLPTQSPTVRSFTKNDNSALKTLITKQTENNNDKESTNELVKSTTYVTISKRSYASTEPMKSPSSNGSQNPSLSSHNSKPTNHIISSGSESDPDPSQDFYVQNQREYLDSLSPPGVVPLPTDRKELMLAINSSITELATYSLPSEGTLFNAGTLATRIRIPAIGVEAIVDELKMVVVGGSLSWETPKHVVGHIPTTAAAGTLGQGWYFGHLESPLKKEGNVFQRLPDIPKLADSVPIYIFLETPNHHYAYQVYMTTIVPKEVLSLSNSGQYDITLVTCTPRFRYDHRLLVTAALVGVKKV